MNEEEGVQVMPKWYSVPEVAALLGYRDSKCAR